MLPFPLGSWDRIWLPLGQRFLLIQFHGQSVVVEGVPLLSVRQRPWCIWHIVEGVSVLLFQQLGLRLWIG